MQSVQGKPVSDDARLEVFNLWERGDISGSDVAGSTELRNILRDLTKKSLYFCCKGVLGYTSLTKQSHLYVCQRTQDLTQKRQLVLMPRGTYKSTIRTKGFPIWMLFNDPQKTMLIANQTTENAEGFLLEIEQQFEGRNDMINWLFPEYIKPGERWRPWSASRMVIPCRTGTSGTPSITAAGCGTRLESRHFDILIPDDLIGTEAMKSEPEMLGAELWHNSLESLFVTPYTGISRESGTRYSGNDFYGKLKKDPRYETIEITAETQNPRTAVFPEILPLEVLDQIKRTNYMLYRLWYMNDATSPELLEFKPDWLQHYMLSKSEENEPIAVLPDGRSILVSDMDVVISIDPAGSGDMATQTTDIVRKSKATKSNNAVVCWGLSGEGDYIKLDSWVGRTQGDNPELELCKHILEMWRSWKGYCRTSYLESFGAQGAIKTVFNMLCKAVGETYPMELIPKGLQQAKTVRIRGNLGGPAQNKKIYIRPGHTQFEEEFIHFPNYDTLDDIDASSWAIQFLRKPTSSMEAEQTGRKDREYRELRRKCVGVCGY
jgi:hypothetical protein